MPGYDIILKVFKFYESGAAMEKFVEQTLLYDFYGELLNEHQRGIYQDIVFNDLIIKRGC